MALASESSREVLYGMKICHYCDKRFIPKTRRHAEYPTPCCSRRCAQLYLYRVVNRGWLRTAKARAMLSEHAKQKGQRKRMAVLERVAAASGGPVSARDLQMFKLGWRMCLDTHRGRLRLLKERLTA